MVEITSASKICGTKYMSLFKAQTGGLHFGVPSKEVRDDSNVC